MDQQTFPPTSVAYQAKLPQSAFKPGQLVKVKVIRVNNSKRQVDLVPLWVASDNPDTHEVAGASDKEDEGKPEKNRAVDAKGQSSAELHGGKGSSDKNNVKSGKKRALAAGGFDWNAQMDGNDSDVSSDNELAVAHKRRKTQSQAEAPVDGSAGTSGPQTANDYEKATLLTPDDSELWIRYMALHLTGGEFSKARAVAEQAIATINLRDQVQRLEVWKAYMRAELAFGNEETLQEVFNRACLDNDEKKVHESLISIYITSQKYDAADKSYQSLIKKFGAETQDVWLNYADFLHKIVGDVARARELLSEAIKRLGRDVIVDLTARFAALEYKSPNGIAERGRTMFEGILASFPKRMDVWSQYVSQEIAAHARAGAGGKSSSAEMVRKVFEDGTRAKGLKPHAAKKWFKRWAEWEESAGGEGAVGREKVAKKAAQWIKETEARKAAATTTATTKGTEAA